METHHILLVEDEAADALLIRRALASLGVRLTIALASSGEEALAYLRQEGAFTGAPRPELILLDLFMPGIGGLGVLQFVRTQPALQGLPVVILTSSQAETDVARAYAYSADGYVTKPASLAAFNQTVRDIVRAWVIRDPRLSGQLAQE